MIRQWSELARGESRIGLEQMSGFNVRNRFSVLALSPGRSGICVGSDINCDRSFTMAKASAS